MEINFRYDSRYENQFKRYIQEAIEYILEQNYGSTVTNNKLATILHFNLEDETSFKQYKNIMLRIKNFLVDYGYILKSITHVGYYILKPKHISSHCYHTYIKRTINLLEKSERILTHVEQKDLSKDRKEELENIKILNMDLDYNIWNTINNSGYYNRKAYYDSLKDD